MVFEASGVDEAADGVVGEVPEAQGDTAQVDCWVFFGQCLFVLQAAFVKSRKSLSTSSGVRYPRAE